MVETQDKITSEKSANGFLLGAATKSSVDYERPQSLPLRQVTACSNCLTERCTKDMWWCRECCVPLCSSCNILRGHSDHRCAPYTTREVALSMARALQQRCQQRVVQAQDEENIVRSYLTDLEKCLLERISKRLSKNNEADAQALNQLVEQYKIDGFMTGLNASQPYKSLPFGARSTITPPASPGTSYLSSFPISASFSQRPSSRPVDVDRKIELAFEELLLHDPKLSSTSVAVRDGASSSGRSLTRMSNGQAMSSSNSLTDIPVDALAKLLEDRLGLVDRSVEVDQQQQHHPGNNPATVLQPPPVPVSISLLSAQQHENFNGNSMLSTSSPIDGCSPSLAKKPPRSPGKASSMPPPPAVIEPKVVVNGNGRMHQNSSSNFGSSTTHSLNTSGASTDESRPFSAAERRRLGSLNDEICMIMDKFSRAPSSCSVQHDSSFNDSSDGSRRFAAVHFTDDLKRPAFNRSLVTSFNFGSDFLTRPIDVVVLSNDINSKTIRLAVSDSCGGVYVTDEQGAIVHHIGTDGGSGSSLFYCRDLGELMVSVMRRDQRRVIMVHSGSSYELKRTVKCPEEPFVDVCRTRWVAATSKGDLFLASGDNKLSALWCLHKSANSWLTLKTQKKSRFQYLCLIENHPTQDTTVVITSDGVNGNLLVFYVSPNGRINAEYNLSDVWELSPSIKNPASAVYDEYGNLLIFDYATGKVWLLCSSESPVAESGHSVNVAATRVEFDRAGFQRSTNSPKRRSFRLLKSKDKSPVAQVTKDRQLKIVFEIGPQSGIGIATHRGWCYIAAFAKKRVIAFKYLEV